MLRQLAEVLYDAPMRHIFNILAVILAVSPLIAAAPSKSIQEPNAVFVYDIPESNRIRATLFDRAKRTDIDHLDTTTKFSLYGGGGIESNDQVQFSAATRRIYVAHSNVNEFNGPKRFDQALPYDAAIIESDFEWTTPAPVFTCNQFCKIDQWIVHPSKPVLYVSLADTYQPNADEFRNAKLIEVTLSPKRRTRVLGRIPANSALHMTTDGKYIYTFRRAMNSDSYGILTTINLATRKSTNVTVNVPSRNAFGIGTSPQSSNVSPDALRMAYHMGIVDVRTGKGEAIDADTAAYDLDNYFIGWSRDGTKVLFQLMEAGGIDDRVEVPLIYDRTSKRKWVLDLQDAHLLDWAPAQTAIIFGKRGDIGFYDLEKREWVFIAKGLDGSWVTLPTKKIPQR